MARPQTQYVCAECGAVSPKWSGKCDSCGAWNSISEESTGGPKFAGSLNTSTSKGRLIELGDLRGKDRPPPRHVTGIGEFDRVCGGGLVPGSALLVGGDPGIGKSTVLLQAAARLAQSGAPVVYVSGEEAADQVRLRARRLGLDDAPVSLAAETNLRDILATLKSGTPPALVIIDSIQTVWSDTLDAAPGTVSQVRACAQELVRFGKECGATVVLVGHVTKEGQIAGPRVVEHLVDTVLYFEGERGHHFRILRAVKNRFGATDEIGVFEMTGSGLSEVANPSSLFLSRNEEGEALTVPGAAVFAGLEGTRPLLVEIQALVSETSFGTPRRAVVGWDSGRLAMVLAVLESRAEIGFGHVDVYLNVAGGLRISEPAADLAVAAALLSARLDVPLPSDSVFFGEISLSGALRPVSGTDSRVKEAAKLGFTQAVAALPSKKPAASLKLNPLALIADLGEYVRNL